MEHLSNDQKDCPNQHENSHKNKKSDFYELQQQYKQLKIMEMSEAWPDIFYDGNSMETETTWSELPNGGKAIVEQILASEGRNKSKRAGLWQSQSGIQIEKWTFWVRSFEIEKL